MKKILLKIGLIFVIGISLLSCRKEAQQVETSSNQDIKVELLFEKDGCKMYRFYDYGHAVYWSDCSGSTSYKYKSGKSTYTKQEVTTNTEENADNYQTTNTNH